MDPTIFIVAPQLPSDRLTDHDPHLGSKTPNLNSDTGELYLQLNAHEIHKYNILDFDIAFVTEAFKRRHQKCVGEKEESVKC